MAKKRANHGCESTEGDNPSTAEDREGEGAEALMGAGHDRVQDL